MNETEIATALDEQEAYVADLRGALHRTVTTSNPFDLDADDVVECGTCGTDLRSVAVCGDAPVGRCGCPLFAIRDGDHWDVCGLLSENGGSVAPGIPA